jgi:hypothetical protein
MAYEDPAHRNDREKKVRFTADDYAVIAWWARQLKKQPAVLIRELVLERIAEIAVSTATRGEGRAA